MEEEKLLKSLKSNLKGLVLSEKNGYTAKRLCEHYREFIGQDLVKESNKLGFSSLSSFLNSLDDIMKRGYNQDGEEVYRGVADDSTRHMVNLISKTPVKKSSGRGGIRGRKPFPHLGRGGRMGKLGRTNEPDHHQRKMRTQGRTNQLDRQHYVPKSLPGFTGFGGPRNDKQNVVGSFLGNVPDVSVEKATNVSTELFNQDSYFKNILEQYFVKHNLGSAPFQVFAVGDLWMASVRVNSMEFSHEESVGGEAEAVEAVSKLCVNKLNILKEDTEVDSSDDWATTVKRIWQLLEGKSWAYSSIIDKQYEKKYREQLPSSWWETMEGVRAEPFNAGSGIMIIFPESSLDKSQTNNSDGIKSPVVDSSPVVPDKQPSLDTPINPEEDQTEDDSNKRLQQALAQVDEVIDIMEVNVEMIFERNKLSELDQRADNLQEGASQFQTRAINPKRKYWRKNITFMIVIGVIIFGVVVPVILIIITSNGVRGSGDSVTTNVPTMATSAVTEE